jgi:phage shock protein PspC (stress-responsive transcriptional regulator)
MTNNSMSAPSNTTSPAWQRSSEHRMVAGVCGGIAERLDLGPNSVRLLAIVLALVTLGTALLGYVVAYLLMDGPHGETAPLRSW